MLSRREREVMDILYRCGEASVAQVCDAMASPPSYSAVRALLGTLEDKGHVQHAKHGKRYVYSPVMPVEAARRGALDRVIATFFHGSARDLVAALVRPDAAEDLSDDELDELAEMITEARRARRGDDLG